ncbi:MAG: metallophosphoesterase [Nitrospiraceae bacterium]|nr:metallophosphoesterase [Nitrospiraceae bacterium]
MLIAVIADLHANLEATRAVFGAVDALAPDAVVCLGDVAGYNANPNEVIDIIRERRIRTLMGNHDAAACGLEEPWFFNSKAQAAIEWQAGVLRDDNRDWLRGLPPHIDLNEYFLCVHGAPANRDDYILDWLDAMRQFESLNDTPVKACFFGHSHRVTAIAEKGSASNEDNPKRCLIAQDNRYFLNPGSVGQPRDGNPLAAFGLLNSDEMTFDFHRVEYDIETTAQKIVDAGLPLALARRLSRGK